MTKDNEALVRLESDRYYILASSSYADDRTKVLNYGDTFAIFDRWGDAKQIGTRTQGIYHEGTRFISELEFRIDGYRPVLLSSNIKNENEVFSIDLTNPRLELNNEMNIEKGLLHISRSKFLQESACYETVIIENYDIKTQEFEYSLLFDGDFKDIFEIRGMERTRRGKLLPREITPEGNLKLSYLGLDNIKRTTWVKFEDLEIDWHRGNYFTQHVTLEPGKRFEIRYSIHCQVSDSTISTDLHREAFEKISGSLTEGKKKIASIITSNEQFNNWLERSKYDLLSLVKSTRHGLYPYAGVPWYNTAFGRDGIITAMEVLWIAPEIAKGVLLFLAANQADKEDPFRDAEPGKILHETRGGEMVELNEIPFKKYYGTIDATPLFISLAGQYYRRTDDKDTVAAIWKNIERALQWITEYGDRDGDGFIEYQQKQDSGLENQGWKDSHDAVSYEDGELAEPPIALCEVQGYVYDAYLQAAYIAESLNKDEQGRIFRRKAKEMKKRFNEVFWDKDMQTFVLALDGKKNPCRIKTSNAGQCLFTGIASSTKAARVVKTLLQPDIYCGWGIRTLSSEARRYNPMSYHNGSVWPHDTALVAAGMARYGYTEEAMKLMQGLFTACLFLDLQRLPELFCGFSFRHGEAPTAYPVACIPQAWSVAAVFLLLQSCLQISIDAPRKRITFNNPNLPDYLNQVIIRNLKVPDGIFELEFNKHEWDIGIHIISKPRDWHVIVRR